MEDIESIQNEPSSSTVNATGGLQEVPSYDPAVMKSTSFGSLNGENENIQDLFVDVEDPEKHIEGYVSYNVLTKTTRSEFDEPSYSARRRYQDFLWLRQRLEENYPTHVIPPLPEKNSFTKHFDRFSEEYLKMRQEALKRFVCRVASHPVLSFSDHFHIFLTAKSWELMTAKKQAPGLISRMGDSVKHAASSIMLKTRDKEFTDIADFAKNFNEKITAMEKVTDKLARERFDLLESYKDCIPVFRLWSNSEIMLADSLSEMANAMEKNNDALKTLLKQQDAGIMEPLKEYILYIEAIRAALKRRDAKQMEYEVTLDELKRKKKEKEEMDPGREFARSLTMYNENDYDREQVKLEKSTQTRSFGVLIGSKDPEEVKKEKIDKLSATIEELESSAELANDKAECANHDLKADIERWHKNKRLDFKQLFTNYSNCLIDYFKKNLDGWNEALNKLNETSLDDDPSLETDY